MSAVHEYMRQRIPMEQWTRPLFSEYQEIIKRLDQLDLKLHQPACEPSEKSEWMADVERRLEILEQPLR